MNLGSLADEQVNRALNEHTPESSPLPTPKHRKEEIEVLIPSNICDPLNLSMPDNLAERALLSPNSVTKKKRPRSRKRRRTNSASEVLDAGQKVPELKTPALDLSAVKQLAEDAGKTQSNADSSGCGSTLKEFKELKLKSDPARHNRRPEDKIVSPVVPQPGARKRCGFFPRSTSKESPIKSLRQSSKGASRETGETAGMPSNPSQAIQAAPPPGSVKGVKKFQYGNYDR